MVKKYIEPQFEIELVYLLEDVLTVSSGETPEGELDGDGDNLFGDDSDLSFGDSWSAEDPAPGFGSDEGSGDSDWEW